MSKSETNELELRAVPQDLHRIDSNIQLDELNYKLPRSKVKAVMNGDAAAGTFALHSNKIPLVLVACGSYSPVTYLHLRMFEMARDHVVEHGEFELLGAYFSPVSSGYKKAGLAYYKHRVRMCQLAVEESEFIDVDPWEAFQTETQRTAIVLRIRIKLVAGGDLIQSFASYEVRNGEKIPVWLPSDLDIILGKFGCFIIERTGSDVHDFLLSHQSLYNHRKRVHVVKQFIYNDISSTKVRLFIKRKMSIRYLLPDSVIAYISRKRLYMVDEPSGRTDGPFDDDDIIQKSLEADEKLEDKFIEVVNMDPYEVEETNRLEALRHQAMNDD
ncbi:hypothetical protein HK100_005101 [Physocladia obscura]|uniref:Nicotinamide-nucleotide adenylyltransferase n=2 Tax=Physocladia obscura TaxID=109957 RepID=A0AAD5XDG7_9FUNG|nr:hypothetical protein HK100_005101 [Physocladia obscura]